MADMGKNLMYIGLLLLVIGCVMHFGGKFIPFGRLPGDINIVGENGSFHFPVVTCILISIILSVIANLFSK